MSCFLPLTYSRLVPEEALDMLQAVAKVGVDPEVADIVRRNLEMCKAELYHLGPEKPAQCSAITDMFKVITETLDNNVSREAPQM